MDFACFVMKHLTMSINFGLKNLFQAQVDLANKYFNNQVRQSEFFNCEERIIISLLMTLLARKVLLVRLYVYLFLVLQNITPHVSSDVNVLDFGNIQDLKLSTDRTVNITNHTRGKVTVQWMGSKCKFVICIVIVFVCYLYL